VSEVAVGLVDEQERAGPFRQLDDRLQRALGEDRAGRVVGTGDADQTGRARSYPAREAVDIELPPVVEREVDDVDVGPDGTRRLEVRRVVGTHHHDVIAGVEQ
jgi:hypothetical protein